MSYLDLDQLGNEDELLRRNIHKFSEEVLRPLSIKLDRISPEGRVRPSSLLFDAIRKMKRVDLHRIHLPKERGGVELSNLQCYIIDEELG